ncbi:MAG: GFA family protein [Albidovulum sp.]
MDEVSHHGSCLCGAVAFTATGPLRAVTACHCTQCRKASGHYWATSSVPSDRFVLTRDQGLVWFRSSDHAERGFCRGCGASLFYKPDGEGRIAIAPGAFDGPTGLTIAKHIFTNEAGDYYAPTGAPPIPAERPGTLSCGCLCGAVSFSLPGSGQVKEITACHCTQCRKLSGYFSASFDAQETDVDWHSLAHLSEYETPGGGRRGFCGVCGSSLYFRSSTGAFSVEAGAVNGPTGGQLREHIFVSDKGDYYPIDDGLPQHDGW